MVWRLTNREFLYLTMIVPNSMPSDVNGEKRELCD